MEAEFDSPWGHALLSGDSDSIESMDWQIARPLIILVVVFLYGLGAVTFTPQLVVSISSNTYFICGGIAFLIAFALSFLFGRKKNEIITWIIIILAIIGGVSIYSGFSSLLYDACIQSGGSEFRMYGGRFPNSSCLDTNGNVIR